MQPPRNELSLIGIIKDVGRVLADVCLVWVRDGQGLVGDGSGGTDAAAAVIKHLTKLGKGQMTKDHRRGKSYDWESGLCEVQPFLPSAGELLERFVTVLLHCLDGSVDGPEQFTILTLAAVFTLQFTEAEMWRAPIIKSRNPVSPVPSRLD